MEEARYCWKLTQKRLKLTHVLQTSTKLSTTSSTRSRTPTTRRWTTRWPSSSSSSGSSLSSSWNRSCSTARRAGSRLAMTRFVPFGSSRAQDSIIFPVREMTRAIYHSFCLTTNISQARFWPNFVQKKHFNCLAHIIVVGQIPWQQHPLMILFPVFLYPLSFTLTLTNGCEVCFISFEPEAFSLSSFKKPV